MIAEWILEKWYDWMNDNDISCCRNQPAQTQRDQMCFKKSVWERKKCCSKTLSFSDFHLIARNPSPEAFACEISRSNLISMNNETLENSRSFDFFMICYYFLLSAVYSLRQFFDPLLKTMIGFFRKCLQIICFFSARTKSNPFWWSALSIIRFHFIFQKKKTELSDQQQHK